MGKTKLVICLICAITVLFGCFDQVGRPQNKGRKQQQEAVVNKNEKASFSSIFNWQGEKQKGKSSNVAKWNPFVGKRSSSPMTTKSFIMFIVISAGAVVLLISVLQNLKTGGGSSRKRG